MCRKASPCSCPRPTKSHALRRESHASQRHLTLSLLHSPKTGDISRIRYSIMRTKLCRQHGRIQNFWEGGPKILNHAFFVCMREPQKTRRRPRICKKCSAPMKRMQVVHSLHYDLKQLSRWLFSRHEVTAPMALKCNPLLYDSGVRYCNS